MLYQNGVGTTCSSEIDLGSHNLCVVSIWSTIEVKWIKWNERLILKQKNMISCFWMMLPQDEDIYTFFEPELPFESPAGPRANAADHLRRSSISQIPQAKSGPKVRFRKQRSLSSIERKVSNYLTGGIWRPAMRDRMTLNEGSSVLDLRGENYFSCTVSRKRSNARYFLGSSGDVVTLLNELAECPQSNWESHQLVSINRGHHAMVILWIYISTTFWSAITIFLSKMRRMLSFSQQ